MDFNIKIHLFEHFIHIDNIYPLSKNHYCVFDDDIELSSPFTYYEYLYRDIDDYAHQLYESNISNVDAHFMLSEYVKAILLEKIHSREIIEYTVNDLLGYQNDTEYSNNFVDFALERIFYRVSNPLILFKDFYLGSYSFNRQYPFDHLQKKFELYAVVASHLSYLPFRAFSRYIDLDKTFYSIDEVKAWEKILFKNLNDSDKLNEFIELRQFVFSTLEKISFLSELYPDLARYIHDMRLENEHLQRKTAFLNPKHPQCAPELIVARYVWDYVYNSDNTINPNLSHTSKVKSALKVISSPALPLPNDMRFVNRIASITAPKEIKNHKDWGKFFMDLNAK